jgi:hypothetical protein
VSKGRSFEGGRAPDRRFEKRRKSSTYLSFNYPAIFAEHGKESPPMVLDSGRSFCHLILTSCLRIAMTITPCFLLPHSQKTRSSRTPPPPNTHTHKQFWWRSKCVSMGKRARPRSLIMGKYGRSFELTFVSPNFPSRHRRIPMTYIDPEVEAQLQHQCLGVSCDETISRSYRSKRKR